MADVASGSIDLDYYPSEVPLVETLPESPAVGQLVLYTGVTPNELLRWTGNSENTARRYAASKSSASVSITDLSDDYALDVTVKTVAAQAGSGTQSPDNVRAISGKTAVAVIVNGASVTLTPDAPLYGLTGYEDEVGNDGHVIRRAQHYTFTGLENVYATSDLGTVLRVRFRMEEDLGIGAGTSAATLRISSHFSADSTDYTGDAQHFIADAASVYLFIPKSLLSSYNAAGAKAWLAAQVTAGTPVQVVYRLATPITATGTAAEISGTNGTNIVTSNGASVVVSYTGSGWAAAGSVQRIGIENVEITPELGIKVSQILTDGTNTKNVYTRLYHGGLEINDADTGDLIGGLFMQNGEVYMFSSALADPRQDDGWATRIFSETNPTYQTLKRSGLSFDKDGVCIGKLWTGVSGVNNVGRVNLCANGETVFISSRDLFGTAVPLPHSYASVDDGQILLHCGYDTTTNGYVSVTAFNVSVEGDGLIPATDGQTDLGYSNSRWKKVYAVSGTIGTSDEREKHDIHPADPEMMCKFIMALDVDWFRLNRLPDESMVGFIAQKFREAMYKAGMPDDYGGYVDELADHSKLALRYEQIIAPLVSVVQAQQRRIDDLEQRLTALEQRLG